MFDIIPVNLPWYYLSTADAGNVIVVKANQISVAFMYFWYTNLSTILISLDKFGLMTNTLTECAAILEYTRCLASYTRFLHICSDAHDPLD